MMMPLFIDYAIYAFYLFALRHVFETRIRCLLIYDTLSCHDGLRAYLRFYIPAFRFIATY